ncbi:disks large-associated protein 3 [Engraulis encrasicolus]|uniref:disks large-associated protein 3 n=1 Tax=Engraulis encrasicolus TaxID=184585 RepID=UPI002FD397B7
MKGYHVSRSLSQQAAGPCHCEEYGGGRPEPHYHHPEHHPPYYPPGGPPGGPDQPPLALPAPPSGGGGGGTFPRAHPPQPAAYDPCEQCLGHGGKMQRVPAGLLDHFEKPFQPDGFHTLQYQRSASGGSRSESPSRIRHLVHSVQRLFAKSHSLEAPSKREYNGAAGGPRGGEYRERGGGHRSGGEEGGERGGERGHHQSRSARRSKSRERSKSGDYRPSSSSHGGHGGGELSSHGGGHRRHHSHHRSRTAGWWSSDDNLDSDSSFLPGGVRGGRGVTAYHESLDATLHELTMKRPKGGPPGACLACSSMVMVGDGGGAHSLKRSTWSAMTVSQARAGGGGGGGYDKALVPIEPKSKERTLQHLQVPFDEWGGAYPEGVGGGEIPCRRMRSGSYIKAMGDDDSNDSDASPKASPKSALIAQREAFRRSISMDQRSTSSKYSCRQCTDAYPNSRTTPKGHARSRSYTRSLTSSQLGDALNRQFEGVCESMFGEMESQAVDALDLPGVFRTRSHSYVRAIQAGCSQDDDCLSVFSMTAPQGSIKGGPVVPYRKVPPPLPPRMSKPMISVTAQSSTESTQDAYFHGSSQPQTQAQTQPQPHPRTKQHSNSVDGAEPSSTRSTSSRAGVYPSSGRNRQNSNSAESLDGGLDSGRGRGGLFREASFQHGGGGGGGGGMMMRPKHSSSADNLLESSGGMRSHRERGMGHGGSLGKSASLPQSAMSFSKMVASGSANTSIDQHKPEGRARKLRPSIAVQVDSSETLSDSEGEGRSLREVHSIGVQVEDDKRRARFKRSNSVTASVQADMELEGGCGFPSGVLVGVATQDKSLQFGCSFQRHSSEPESAGQYAPEYTRTVHTQGQWGGYGDDYPHPHQLPPLHPHHHYGQDPISDPRTGGGGPPPRAHSPLPHERSAVVAWHETGAGGPRSLPDSGRNTPSMRDGEFFLRLLQTEVERMEGWCHSMEREAEENELPEEVLEMMRSAIGSAQMLMSQKVQQFFRMCQQSVDPSAYPQPTCQDLSSFWELLQLSIEDVRVKFQDLQRLRDSGWRLAADKKEEKKGPPPLPKKPLGGVTGSLRADSLSDGSGVLVMSRVGAGGAGSGGPGLPVREKSLDLVDRQRQETRRRLLQTKRSASFRQNSATESADSIEIYIPEAQTRL